MIEPWVRFVVRFPPRLRRRIGEAAKFYRRSINAEIIMRLDHSLSGIPRMSVEDVIQPTMFDQIEMSLRADLSDEEQQLVRSYRRMSAKQRQALLDLLTD